MSDSEMSFTRRALVAVSIGVGILILALLAWYAVDVLMLVFAGILFGVLLRGLSRPLAARTGMGQGWSLAVVLVVLVAVIGLASWLLAGQIARQANELSEQLPRAIEQLSARLEASGWGRRILAQIPSPDELMNTRGNVLGRVTGIFSGVLGALVTFVVIITLGCYIAAEPRMYRRGLLHLIPPRHRARAREVLAELDTTLGRWLIGRLVLMFVNGCLTALGLWFLGVPLALTLGLLTGILNFIPNFGPLIAGVPAVLVALLVSPQIALYTALLYLVIQMVDGYVFTPLVDRRSVELPPVLTISAQVLLGVLVGTIGIILASPLTAAVIVLVRMLYVEDTLGDDVASGDEDKTRAAT